MQCCGAPIHVGQVVNLSCIKDKPYTSACGIEVDFDEEHHGGGANCQIRGKVKKIRSVFVDCFANMLASAVFINTDIIDVQGLDISEEITADLLLVNRDGVALHGIRIINCSEDGACVVL